MALQRDTPACQRPKGRYGMKRFILWIIALDVQLFFMSFKKRSQSPRPRVIC